MGKATVVLSGGQDSTTCLFWALNQSYEEVRAVTFDYGQRHHAELQAAKDVVSMAGLRLKWKVITLHPDTLRSQSPLTSDNELEQYKDHASLPGGLESTFVPMRNQTFLTIAAAEAYRNGHTNLITGTCQEDSGGYPDCRRTFIDALEQACNLGTFTGKGALTNLKIHTPLMDLTKAQSVDLAIRLGWDCWRALAYSHTAYDGAFPPTGKDHATLLRQKGFEEHGTPDPLVLRAIVEEGMEVPLSDNYLFTESVLADPDFKNENTESLLRAVWEYEVNV